MSQPVSRVKKPSTVPVKGLDGKYHFVYRTINTENGKFYLGVHSTSVLKDGYIGSGTVLKKAVSKYGREAFYREVLGYFRTREEANNFELLKITEPLRTSDSTYNLKPGGSGGFHYINENGLNNVGKDPNHLKDWVTRNGGPANKGKKLVIINGKKTYQ